jgi:uncharacterized protein YacL
MTEKLTEKEILMLKRIRAGKIHEKAKKGISTFKREFKKEMKTAILAAFGFLIALVWKDVITSLVNNIAQEASFGGAIVSALIVTIICVLGIMLFSRVLKNEGEIEKKDENKK